MRRQKGHACRRGTCRSSASARSPPACAGRAAFESPVSCNPLLPHLHVRVNCCGESQRVPCIQISPWLAHVQPSQTLCGTSRVCCATQEFRRLTHADTVCAAVCAGGHPDERARRAAEHGAARRAAQEPGHPGGVRRHVCGAAHCFAAQVVLLWILSLLQQYFHSFTLQVLGHVPSVYRSCRHGVYGVLLHPLLCHAAVVRRS